MLDEILELSDKIAKLLSTFKVGLILGIIINLIIMSVLCKFTGIFFKKLKKKFSEKDNSIVFVQILPVFEKIIKFLIVFIITASFLQSQGYSLSSLIAGFGITGLAVSFAAQQTIASMFGTVAILSDKTYKIGDYIKVNGNEGIVESISLRSTKIRTLENFLLVVPNDTMANSVVENVSRANKRRLDLVFGVTYDTSNEKLTQAMDIIRNIVSNRKDIYKEINVFTDVLDSSSINIRLIAYAKTKEYDAFTKIKSEVQLEIIRCFREENIDFAFPSTTVYMAK